jgi:hypothetical protein
MQSMGNDDEVEFQEIESRFFRRSKVVFSGDRKSFFQEIKRTIMRSKVFFSRLKLSIIFDNFDQGIKS